MTTRRAIVATAIFGAALTWCGSPASASPLPLVCTIPTSTTLNVLPAGCVAVLTNGPVTYTGVLAFGGHTHNVEITSMMLFGMNTPAASAQLFVEGSDRDITAGTTTHFSYTDTNDSFETNPTVNAYLPDTGPHTFDIIHFINHFGGVMTLKLNFGEVPPHPSQGGLDKVTSSADTTTSPGYFTVNSFFDVFTELTLDGSAHWTLADNDFIPGTNNAGPGTQLQLTNVPEPGTLILTALGLTGIVRRFRRRSHVRSA